MNKTNLKRYAPQARKDFIAAVTARAQLLGLSEVAGQPYAEPCEVNGDVAVIAGRAWPASVQGKRDRLLQRMKRDGYTVTLDAVAYTWFNRFAALRYMELHDYLGHGRCVLSNPNGALPEILSHALELAEAGDLPGLQAEQVRQLKLDNQDGELYRRVLIAQCNALHGAMPFLFEAIDDETEILLHDNLLLSDSVIAKLVSEIPEEDWTEVEAIGWLYQFYISEKKDEVIGKVVKSEDIPAATQLFTPNWIVQYLVQNSVGRLWLMANPTSTLASQWPYYIQPAEQTPEVQAQLDALIQTRIREDGEALNPESITVLDPACGSGHILVVAYDVLKAIYLERGYQPRTIPRLILEKNLYGLDIDDRAAQLAAFALLMKARADDRRLFNNPPMLNVLSLQESKRLDADELAAHLAPFDLQRVPLKSLVDTFEHAKTFGSLIQIPAGLNEQLAAMTVGLQQASRDGDLYARQATKDVLPLVLQAKVLAMQFDAVVANPPYMGNKYLAPALKSHLKANYAGYEKDLFSAFMIRDLSLAKPSGLLGFMSPFVWMFISSYEKLRTHLIDCSTLKSLIQLEYSGFDGATVPICTFTLAKQHAKDYVGSYVRLSDFRGSEQQGPRTLEAIRNKDCGWFYAAKPDDFKEIPGAPVAFWVNQKIRASFKNDKKYDDIFFVKAGMCTGKNAEFILYWHEVDVSLIRTADGQSFSYVPHNKGGDFRKWSGNFDWVLKYSKRHIGEMSKNEGFRHDGKEYYFRPHIGWSKITSSLSSFRFYPEGYAFDSAGLGLFAKTDEATYKTALAFLNSKVAAYLINLLNPTLNVTPEIIKKIPYVAPKNWDASVVDQLTEFLRADWVDFETARGFDRLGFVDVGCFSLSDAWHKWGQLKNQQRERVRSIEVENGKIFAEALGLTDEISLDIPDDEINIARADREKDSQRLISYAIGCMMGRYSLDETGLIYAHAGNVGFDPSRYEKKFLADADGIVPITNERWFEDDAAGRVREFLHAVWGPDTLEENLAWLAESLGTKGSEPPDETIRRYLADKFVKDHLQTYKKRPIYWLFSSGKQGAFQALVYLHRYHEGTLARMRSEYVLPLTGKMQARMESLEVDIRQASSTAARNKLTKQLDALRKQHHELLSYDEKLRHYADQRITIDLDDGVKVNYGKFGDLLAEVKAVTGGAGDE